MENINKIQIVPDEVYEVGADKVNVIPEWSVKDDSTLFEKVRKLAHSTYVGHQASNASPLDPKKFIKVGSPNITSDGIASGFSSSNYINMPNLNISDVADFELITPVFEFDSYSSIYSCPLNWGSCSNTQFVIFIRPSTNKLAVRAQQSGPSVVAMDEFEYLLNTKYQYKFKIKDGIWSIYESINGSNWDLKKSTSNATTVTITGTRPLGWQDSSSYMDNGSIDLKGVNIKVDGVPVFSGSKTGTDVIKPADFTVYTSTMKAFVYDTHTIYADSDSAPTELYNADGTKYTGSEWAIDGTNVKYNSDTATYTSASDITSVTNPPLPFSAGCKIAEGGIASGFSSSNYLRTPTTIGFSTADSWVIYSPKIKLTSLTVINPLFGVPLAPETVNLFIRPNRLTCWSVAYSGGSSFIFKRDVNTLIQLNVTYQFKFEFTGSRYNLYMSTDNSSFVLVDTYESSSKPSDSYIYLGVIIDNWLREGSIDLNSLKIYVDGDLVYQPCLKIPYTEAELNQKVVDVKYRDRVKDLFEQVSYNGYHTIDEDNKNFTLPTHKFTDIIDHKEDADGTVAEQRVDMTVEAYGTATNGTDVNLPIEFADGTSYLVGGVTTSSKTSTKFTPSSSGTWFARGKGKI